MFQTTKRIIDDHKPLVEDLQSSGYELAEVCSDDDGSTVRSVVDDIAAKYEKVRQSVRDKVNILDEALRNVTSDVSIGACLWWCGWVSVSSIGHL